MGTLSMFALVPVVGSRTVVVRDAVGTARVSILVVGEASAGLGNGCLVGLPGADSSVLMTYVVIS